MNHSSFPKERKKGKLLPTQERRSKIIGFPKVQTSSFLSQLSVKKCMCELGDFYIFHELLVAVGGEKKENFFCYVITLQFSERHTASSTSCTFLHSNYAPFPELRAVLILIGIFTPLPVESWRHSSAYNNNNYDCC